MNVFLITQEHVDAFANPDSIKQAAGFESISSLTNKVVERAIFKSLKRLESSFYIGHRLVGMRATNDILGDLSIAIEDLTISYLFKNTDEKILKGIKSERLSNYSYTLSDDVSKGNFDVDISYLLEEFMQLNDLIKDAKSLVRVRVI